MPVKPGLGAAVEPCMKAETNRAVSESARTEVWLALAMVVLSGKVGWKRAFVPLTFWLRLMNTKIVMA